MKPAVLKKWIPAVLAPAVIAAFAIGASISADAQVQLEPKTPQQVLQMIAGSKVTDFSGSTSTTLDLGIPQLPDLGSNGTMATPGPGASASPDSTTAPDEANLMDMLAALSGTHEAQVYVDGPNKARIQVLDGMDEQNFIRNGSSLWHYDSSNNTADHMVVPGFPHMIAPKHSTMPPTPGAVADTLLAAMGPSTDMSVADGTRIANRDVYTLELVPRSVDSLVAKVSIGVDAATGAPLQVVVDAVGQTNPAVSVGFTTFTPGTPAANIFEFNPPAGAKVNEHKVPPQALKHNPGHKPDAANPGNKLGHKPGKAKPGKQPGHRLDAAKPGHKNAMQVPDSIKGTGWDTVVVVPAKEVPKELSGNAMLNQLATPVQGGKLLHTSLLNVLLTQDGRMVLGPVSLARLQAVANGQ
ncbi:hypothetical protein GCM10009715_36160 [Paeniglutamicibacter psychrophenolicus]|uniref:Outer membrane lipoprotein-sorting protein n=1 Tax=Paeniglutamicibacter psychrophenolicus TaxID=257454 RepID=A0ABS4WAI2_9MICC|nr:outer membrane lipoprotein carrier protein LolA [Paeniglutamicibacter psychrophenolicus]MBP2373202.1 outer membrane lipoprotein-sorting protein [Paeniglutamicibacter psychrophenolicus]